MYFHERLKYLREDNGYKQKEIASLIGVKNNTLSSYESGVRQPDYDTLIRLADIYGKTVDYLLRGYTPKMKESFIVIETDHLTETDIHEINKYIDFLKWKKDNK